MVGETTKTMLGSIGGMIAIIGVIVLPITSGDTALRSARLMIADALHTDQRSSIKRIAVALTIFIPVIIVSSFIINQKIGFGLPYNVSIIISLVLSLVYFLLIYRVGKNYNSKYPDRLVV